MNVISGFLDTAERWARSTLYFKFIDFDFLHFVPALEET
jgi:hypothetical protein